MPWDINDIIPSIEHIALFQAREDARSQHATTHFVNDRIWFVIVVHVFKITNGNRAVIAGRGSCGVILRILLVFLFKRCNVGIAQIARSREVLFTLLLVRSTLFDDRFDLFDRLVTLSSNFFDHLERFRGFGIFRRSQERA